MLKITVITDRNQWNRLLATMPYAHVLQTWEWGQFKYETTGWFPHRWAFYYEGHEKIVALCSMGERKVGPSSFMYAPKGPALDYSNMTLVNDVLELLQAIAKQHRTIWLKIDPDLPYATGIPDEGDDSVAEPGIAIMNVLQASGWRLSDEQVQFRNTITIDLSLSEDEILMGMSGNTRRKVRQAEKKDVTIRDGTSDDLDTLYELYSTTGERNEFLIRPKEYYLKLWRFFLESNLAHVLIAEHNHSPIAQVILFHFGQTCWYFYGASSNEERHRMPNYLLQWQAMKWAKTQGYKIYDMWGAPNNFSEDDSMWGVFMFKQGFRGTVERRLGAWDFAPQPLLYTVFTQGWPKLRGLLRGFKS